MRVAQTIADPPRVMIAGPAPSREGRSSHYGSVDASGTMERSTFMSQAYVPEPLVYVLHPTPIRVTVIMEHSEGEKPSR